MYQREQKKRNAEILRILMFFIINFVTTTLTLYTSTQYYTIVNIIFFPSSLL